MVDINPTISIMSWNVYDLNIPIKRKKLSEWIKKQDSTIYCIQENHIKIKSKWMEKDTLC